MIQRLLNQVIMADIFYHTGKLSVMIKTTIANYRTL